MRRSMMKKLGYVLDAVTTPDFVIPFVIFVLVVEFGMMLFRDQ